MRFNITGQRLGGIGITQQIIPDPSTTTPVERYNQSQIVTVTRDEVAYYPSPTWEQKELEVYPCQPGAILNRSTDISCANMPECYTKSTQCLGTYAKDPDVCQSAICSLCPQGKSRNNASLVCRECNTQSYSDQPGLEECIPCVQGMDCNSSFVGEPPSKAGFYRLQNESVSSWLYFQCDPPELCLGDNKCLGLNQGVMCNQCPIGYSNRGWNSLGGDPGLCVKC